MLWQQPIKSSLRSARDRGQFAGAFSIARRFAPAAKWGEHFRIQSSGKTLIFLGKNAIFSLRGMPESF